MSIIHTYADVCIHMYIIHMYNNTHTANANRNMDKTQVHFNRLHQLMTCKKQKMKRNVGNLNIN